MTNAPITRKTHVIRIAGTNANGDVLQNIWVDIERMDITKSVTQTKDSPNYQGHQRKFKWQDDPTADDYNPDGVPSQDTIIIKVCDPNDDLSDPSQWVPVRVRKLAKSTGGGQGVQDKFRDDPDEDDPDPTTRVVEVRRIAHYATNIDDAAQAAFDVDDTLTAFVVPGDQYQRDDTTEDPDQYLLHEVITSLKHMTNVQSETDGGTDTGRQTKLLNQYLIDESDAPHGDEPIGAIGINPPYRLDPWQNIVNVKFKTLYLVVAVGADNSSTNSGFSASPAVSAPSVSSSGDPSKGVTLLDSLPIPGGNSSTSGFANCFAYPDSYATPEAAFLAFEGDGPGSGPWTEFPAVNGACAWPGGGSPPDHTTIAPFIFGRGNSVATYYLYEIPAGDGVVSVNVRGLMPTFDSGGDFPIDINGTGSVAASVFSTVRGKRITKVGQLIDYANDGKPRPTEDDGRILSVNSTNQGKFLINVNLDKNVADAQTDNYGNTFQPYKVTFDRGASVDNIPSQPPPRLPT